MNVLCVAAHPDDETLGCGATLAKHADAGDVVRVLVLGTGVMARAGASDAAVEALHYSAVAAMRILTPAGVSFVQFSWPDQRLDTVPLLDLTQQIESEAQSFRPEVVYTHNPADLNMDHAITARATLTACRPLPGSTVRRVLAFEVPSSTEYSAGYQPFAPTVHVDVTGQPMVRKLQALGAYASEMRPFPHPRCAQSITALATWRGSSVGVEAAEAFMLLREIA